MVKVIFLFIFFGCSAFILDGIAISQAAPAQDHAFEFEYIELKSQNWEANGETIKIKQDGEFSVKYESPSSPFEPGRKGKVEAHSFIQLVELLDNAQVFL